MTENVVCSVHEALKEDVDYAVDSALKAFPRWSSLNAHERAAPMFKLARLIQRDAQELAELDSICMGKYVCLNCYLPGQPDSDLTDPLSY